MPTESRGDPDLVELIDFRLNSPAAEHHAARAKCLSELAPSSHATSSHAGTGRDTTYPWIRSQPNPARRSQAASSSTPSATTVRFRSCPRLIVERTIAACCALKAMPTTKDRSIFSSSTGKPTRYASDE